MLETPTQGPSTPSGESPKGGFSWSASRHDSFATCKRRYYYSYYAAANDPEIRRLKKLSALPLWAGSVVHDTIEAFLRANDRLPSLEDQEALIRSVVHSGMLSSWRESEAFVQVAEATLPPAASPEAAAEAAREPFRLFEHEYGIPIEQEDKRLAVNIVMRSLKNFFKSDTLQRALEVGPRALARARGPRLVPRRRRRGAAAHGPRLSRPRRPRRDRGLEDGARRGALQRGPGRGLRALRRGAGMGEASPRRSRPSSTTS